MAKNDGSQKFWKLRLQPQPLEDAYLGELGLRTLPAVLGANFTFTQPCTFVRLVTARKVNSRCQPPLERCDQRLGSALDHCGGRSVRRVGNRTGTSVLLAGHSE